MENRLPPEKRDLRWVKNNFRGHEVSWPTPWASLSLQSFSLVPVHPLLSKLNARLDKPSKSLWQKECNYLLIWLLVVQLITRNSLLIENETAKEVIPNVLRSKKYTSWQPTDRSWFNSEVILILSSRYLVTITESKVVNEKKKLLIQRSYHYLMSNKRRQWL